MGGGVASPRWSLPTRSARGESAVAGWSSALFIASHSSTRVRQGAAMRALARGHADGTVQANYFAVQHLVFDDVLGERGVLVGATQTWWEGHLLAEGDARGLGQS